MRVILSRRLNLTLIYASLVLEQPASRSHVNLQTPTYVSAFLSPAACILIAAVDSLSEIDDVGRLPGKEALNRLRYFGGTTNIWGGHCTPLEPDDFKKQDWIAYSGWPYDYNELHPYYIRAHDVLGLGEFSYIPENIGSALGFKTFPFDKKILATTVSRYHQVRFGIKYGDELDRAKNIKVILYSDVSEIRWLTRRLITSSMC